MCVEAGAWRRGKLQLALVSRLYKHAAASEAREQHQRSAEEEVMMMIATAKCGGVAEFFL